MSQADPRQPPQERTPGEHPPCIVDLGATGGSLPAVRARFADSLARARATLAAMPAVRRSFGRWCLIAWLLLAGATVALGAGAASPGRVAGAAAILAAWGLLWQGLIRVHLGLVRHPDGTPRPGFGVPNGLTYLRIVMVPAGAWLILAHGRLEDHAVLAAILFFLLGFTDLLDGLIARATRWGTPLGQYLDHLADVLIVSAVAVAEYLAGLLPGWLTGLLLLRYVGTGAGGILALATVRQTRIAPTGIGKLTTAVVGLTVYLALARPLVFPGLAPVMPWLHRATGLTVAVNLAVLVVQLVRADRGGDPVPNKP
jgi:phosphatidylglycerophosphate synthase